MQTATLVRAGARRIGGMAREHLYLSTGLDLTAPESIQGIVNQRCNYKCRYCHFWRIKQYADEISIDEWQQALMSLKEFIGRYVIQFAGGEPFIKKGFVDLLAFCRANGIDWGVTTNGSALGATIVAKVVAACPTNFDVSVDSPDAAVNDLVRGAPGSLDAIGAGIARLRAERDRVGRYFPIRLTPTVSRSTFRSLPRLLAWAAAHGADTVDFHPVHAMPFWTAQMRAELWIGLDDIDAFRTVVDELVEMKRAGAPIETAEERLRSFPDQFLGLPVRAGIAGPCRTGMRDYIIESTGDVRVCWDYPSIGNVRAASAREIWRAATAKAMRAQTVACPKLGKECANSCLDHRSLLQEARRALMLLRAKAG